jgi:hypothetical protein
MLRPAFQMVIMVINNIIMLIMVINRWLLWSLTIMVKHNLQ